MLKLIYHIVLRLGLGLGLGGFILACTNQSVPEFTSFDQLLQDQVEHGHIAGASALIIKDGKEVYFGAFGQADREKKKPMRRDTLVNIYSMTKPITGTVLMTLYEEGLFQLDDPLSKYLPEYKNLHVWTGEVDDSGDIITVPAQRPIQIIDIMRHTSGYTYGWEGDALAAVTNEANLLDPQITLEAFSKRAATLPLRFQPGTQWGYSFSVDIQARLAEVLGKQPYNELLQSRVLGPLGMTDTGYFVPPSDKPRLSAIYITQEDGQLLRERDQQVYGFAPTPPRLTAGGHGLISTLDDYSRFAQMLLGQGTYKNIQILKPETVALMSQDHLPKELTEKSFLGEKGQIGFGIDFAVRTAPPASVDEARGEVGEFFWDGRASTLFWVDPINDMTVIFFTQIVPFNSELHTDIRAAVYSDLQ